jgi:hypothetical protein
MLKRENKLLCRLCILKSVINVITESLGQALYLFYTREIGVGLPQKQADLKRQKNIYLVIKYPGKKAGRKINSTAFDRICRHCFLGKVKPHNSGLPQKSPFP